MTSPSSLRVFSPKLGIIIIITFYHLLCSHLKLLWKSFKNFLKILIQRFSLFFIGKAISDTTILPVFINKKSPSHNWFSEVFIHKGRLVNLICELSDLTRWWSSFFEIYTRDQIIKTCTWSLADGLVFPVPPVLTWHLLSIRLCTTFTYFWCITFFSCFIYTQSSSFLNKSQNMR